MEHIIQNTRILMNTGNKKHDNLTDWVKATETAPEKKYTDRSIEC